RGRAASHPKPPQGHHKATTRPYTRHRLRSTKPPQGHPQATPKRHQSHPHATPKLSTSQVHARKKPTAREPADGESTPCAYRVERLWQSGVSRVAGGGPPGPPNIASRRNYHDSKAD